LAIVGESGSGKSVSTQTITGLTRGARVEGTALFEGKDLIGATEEELRSIRGVLGVEPDPQNPGIWLVTGELDVDDRVARALLAKGLAIRHLRRRGGELDEIYHRYFQQGRRTDGHG
jgi:ABC-type dipeptide/oligopeptide/nickel transport system ATPase component